MPGGGGAFMGGSESSSCSFACCPRDRCGAALDFDRTAKVPASPGPMADDFRIDSETIKRDLNFSRCNGIKFEQTRKRFVDRKPY